MRDLVTGYAVQPQGVLFTVLGRISLRAGEDLNHRISSQRWCVGYDDPRAGLGSCPDEAPAAKGERCEACSKRTMMELCRACVGLNCANLARRAGCVPVDHFVYLALYDNDNVKVGVTKAERLEARIREQGAQAGLAIATAGGQVARRIEYEIGNAGWRDRLKLLPFLCSPQLERDEAQRLLADELEKVRERLPHIRFMDEGGFVWCGDTLPPTLKEAPRQLNLATDALAGTVIGTRGNYLLLDSGGEVVACSLRALVGHELTRAEERLTGPAQAAFVF